MVKKIGDKKLDKVKSTENVGQVQEAPGIGGIGAVGKTQAVGSAGGAGTIQRRRATRTMTLEEREALMKIMNEEAEKMFGQASPQHRKIVEGAVKMTIDAALGEEIDDKGKK